MKLNSLKGSISKVIADRRYKRTISLLNIENNDALNQKEYALVFKQEGVILQIKGTSFVFRTLDPAFNKVKVLEAQGIY